jgi:8-oxo-dGTP diphosphatase
MQTTQDNALFHIVQVQGWIRKGEKFLMAQRSLQELQAPGAWSIPGGKVEGEAGVEEFILQRTLKREILEEVGLVVGDRIELVYNDSFTRVDGSHVVALTFLCDWVSGEAMPLEDTEKVKWFTLEELKNFPDAENFLKRMIEALVEYIEKR